MPGKAGIRKMSKMIKHCYQWIIGLGMIAVLVGGTWSFYRPVAAQDSGNLLTNGSFEPPYAGQGSSTRTVPNGWTLLVAAGAPDAFPHNDPIQILDGTVSWNIKQGYTVFTAAAYQRVGGLKAGDVLRATAYGWVYTCNNTATSCVIANPPYRQSDTSAGAQLRVGLDPKGGTDPTSGDIKWSAPAAPYDQWAEMSVTAKAAGDTVTMYLYMTQSAGLAINNVYWDKASLVRTEYAPDATATPLQVPFVKPQNVRPDGSIIHVVQAGDTLSSIAYAYRDYHVTNESIAALNPPMKPNTRVLQIGQEIVILPPGSVDPATGQLLPAGSTIPPTIAPASTPIAALSTPVAGATPEAATPADTSAPTYTTVKAGFLLFEHGYMFWVEDTNQILVLVNGPTPGTGTFTQYQDTWREGMPETDPALVPPEGFTQPTRSFGQAWRTYPGVKDSLGWSIGETINFTALVVRQKDKVIINGPDNRVYEFAGTGTWTVIDYYAP
jgi:LysM repeat protein